jgi:hypothetical protein
MAKIVVTDNVADVVLPTRSVEQNRSITPPKYRIQFLSSEIKQDEELQYEVAKIRVRPAFVDNFYNSVSSDFTGQKSNHFFKLPKMVDLVETETTDYNTSVAQASFSFETIFNYVSEDYDKLQVGIEEYNLYAPFDKASKQDFLSVSSRSTEVVNFGRGSQMRNFVMPTQLIKQGSEDSPYYNYLRINQRIDNGISHFSQKIGVFDEILQDYLFGDGTNITFKIEENGETLEVPKRLYSVGSFFNKVTELDTDNFFTLRESTAQSNMSFALRKHLMKGFLKDASKTGFRTYEDIYRGIEAHKEAFCYSVDKHDGNIQDSTKIQSLYAPALEESTPVIDTQVKYGKTYGYKVVGHYMIVGNTYTYSVKMSSPDSDDPYVDVEVINRPSIVMMPFDVLEKKINVVQMPPVFPQVSFKTKNDAKNKISIYLSPSKTDKIEDFTTITTEDNQQLIALRQLPNARNIQGKFKFKTYGDQGLFEVFRLDMPPMSYSDFKDAKIGEISMPFETTDAIFRDAVAANKKYYYMFRSVNQKGFVSNPTAVYEVEMLIDADESKVITDTYDFPKPREMESTLEFRKLFRIIPAVEHVLFDPSQDVLEGKRSLVGTLDNLKLGIASKAVWGRKFKIRIKSKTSGKMIDFILNVDLTKNKTEEEF